MWPVVVVIPSLLTVALLGCFWVLWTFRKQWLLSISRMPTLHLPPRGPHAAGGPDVVIIGSGVLGSALAVVLARDGRKVTVIERSLSAPDRVVGEGLPAGGVRQLHALGLADCIPEMEARQITGIVFTDVTTKQRVRIDYDETQYGLNFNHGNFVQALRRRAQRESNCTYIEGSVLSLLEEDGFVRGVTYRKRNSDQIEVLNAQLTVVADGLFSRFRKINVRMQPSRTSYAVALEHHGSMEIPDTTYIYMLYDDYMVFYPLEERLWRIFIDIKEPLPDDMKAYLRKLGEGLPGGLREAYLTAVMKNPIKTTQSLELPTRMAFHPGVLTLGDALNIRHPITASGMTCALHDVVLWRHYLRLIPDLRDASAMQSAQRQFLLERPSPSMISNMNSKLIYQTSKPQTDMNRFSRSMFLKLLEKGYFWQKLSIDLFILTETNPIKLIFFSLCITLFTAYNVVVREPWYQLPLVACRAVTMVATNVRRLGALTWTEMKGMWLHN